MKLSKEDFEDLTPYEFSLLQLHFERTLKADYSILRNTIYNAGVNLLRKKGDEEVPLFDKDEESEKDPTTLSHERDALFRGFPG